MKKTVTLFMKQVYGFNKKKKKSLRIFLTSSVFISSCREVKLVVKNKKSLPHVRNTFDFGFQPTVSKPFLGTVLSVEESSDVFSFSPAPTRCVLARTSAASSFFPLHFPAPPHLHPHNCFSRNT